MPARLALAAFLLLATTVASGCTGGSGSSAATAAGTAAVAASTTSAGADASPAAAGETVTSVDVGELVCTALAEIVADDKAAPYIPDAAIAQFGIKTLGSADGAAYPAIVAGADAAATAQCPADRDAVLAIAERDSLSSMLTDG